MLTLGCGRRGTGPTALDAAAFAYLYVLHAEDDLRVEMARRVKLIRWERRIHERVCAAMLHSCRTELRSDKRAPVRIFSGLYLVCCN